MKNRSLSAYHHLPILDGMELLSAKAHTLDFPFHRHDTLTLSLIFDTPFHTQLPDKCITAIPGTLTITNPDEVHATPCDPDFGNSFFTYYVSPDIFRKISRGKSFFFEDRIIDDAALFQELYFLSNNIKHTSIDFETRLLSAFSRMVSQYASPESFQFKTSQLFQEFINEIPSEAFSLAKTAALFGLDKFKFIRLFKQETGLTPNNYVLLQRIERSKAMLKAGKPIFDTAIDTGFYDLSHFYRNFKRFTGVTPLEFQATLSGKS